METPSFQGAVFLNRKICDLIFLVDSDFDGVRFSLLVSNFSVLAFHYFRHSVILGSYSGSFEHLAVLYRHISITYNYTKT